MRRPVPVRPSKRPVYNAGSAVEVPYVSRSTQLEDVVPSAARYRVDDLTHSRVIADWASVSPLAARGTVTVSAALNAMFGEFEPTELRQVTFEFTDSGGNVRQELAHYELARVYQGATA